MNYMCECKNILMVGVGGQGIILVSKVLAHGLVKAGYDVKVSEVHGMAKRGGCVSTQVRYGDKVCSPIIGRGQANILVAFERMEAVRYAEFLRRDAIAIINDYAMVPTNVAAGNVRYPEGIIEAMSRFVKTVSLDAAEIATGLGNTKCMNSVLLGAMVETLQMVTVDWVEVLEEIIPSNLLSINLQAFGAGRKALRNSRCSTINIT